MNLHMPVLKASFSKHPESLSSITIPGFWQVIYVKPGCEADLDSLIQDTIRLSTSVKVRKDANTIMLGNHYSWHPNSV